MKLFVIAAITLALLTANRVWADASPTSQPSSGTTINELQLQANETMGRGDYANALPLLQKVSELLVDQPDQLGPVLEQIRVCRHQMLAVASNPKLSTVPVTSVAIAVDNGPRHIHPAPVPGQTLQLPIKELGHLAYDAVNGGGIPDDVTRLDGCHFQTSGYMIPLDQAESISKFALVPSLFACCFGQPPQIQHTIVVTCPKSKAVNYYPDEIVVQGKLTVEEKKDDGFIVSLFEVEANSVKPAAK